MVNVRTLTLVNSYGEEYPLTGQNGFITNLSGLGIEKESTILTNQNYSKLATKFDVYPDITGDMIFIDEFSNNNDIKIDAYRFSNMFEKWIEQSELAGKLYLRYELPTNISDDYPDLALKSTSVVNFTKLTKGEKDENGNLIQEIVFNRLTPWVDPVKKYTSISRQTTEAIYDLEVEFNEEVNYGSSSSRSEIITNLGTTASPLEFYINGLAVNPQITLINVNTGVTLQNWRLNATVALDSVVYHNSTPFEQRVELNGSNIYGALERGPGFSQFIYVPPGTYIITYNAENSDFGDLDIYYRNAWGYL